jgi:MFS family permease
VARDLRLFYLFRLLATSYLWVPIFYFFMLSRGLGFDEIMILSAIYSGVVILVEVPTGAFADRIGRRQSMMAGSLAMVASCLVAYSSHSFTQFLIAEVLAATSMSLCSGADSAYLYDLLQNNGRTEEYARREGTASAWHQGGSALAFAAGGFLAEIDLSLPYLVTAMVSSAAFVVALCMRGEGKVAEEHQRGAPLGDELRKYFKLMGDSLRDVANNRKLAWIIFYSAVVFALLRATIYLYQPYLDVRGFEYWQIGLVFFGIYVVATFMAHRADSLRRTFGEDALVWGLLGTLAVSFILLNQFSGEWAVGMLMIQAATKGLYSPLVKPILNREIHDSSRRATVLSVESIARRTAMGAFSLIAAFYGARSAIYLGGAIGLVGFALLLVMAAWAPMRRHRTAVARVPAPVEERRGSAPGSAPATLD